MSLIWHLPDWLMISIPSDGITNQLIGVTLVFLAGVFGSFCVSKIEKW